MHHFAGPDLSKLARRKKFDDGFGLISTVADFLD
jgi:hypothetical protein